jgi:glycosyltransferase involved in cell wall biosynthesis
MKVLKVIHTLGHGGAENTFRWLAWGLAKEGIEVIAAVPEVSNSSEENWIACALEELEIPYVTFDKSGSPVKLLKNIGAIIDQVRPDIVHSHLLDSNFYSSLASKRRFVPHISTEHGDVSFRQTVVSRIKYGMISLGSRYIICVSDAVRERASSVIPFRYKLKTVYNGIRFFEPNISTFRDEFGIPQNAVLVGNVGNLYPIKGQKFLIMAFSELLRSFSECLYLVLVGRGAEQESLKKLVRDLGIPDGKVLFTGFRNDIENVMNAMDLYVQPSLSEGHPIAVLEAMSLGKPVIATAVGGVPEIIGQDRYGTLATPGSWENLYDCMLEYLHRPEVFRERALAAKMHVRDAFSIEKMAHNYIDIYRRALLPGGS